MDFKIITGIDLHGTLLTDDEIIMENTREKLLNSLKQKPSFLKNYICTGNDLGFIIRKIPKGILDLFDGAVLETGCVFSDNFIDEKIIVPKKVVDKIKNLENILKDKKWIEVYKFANRLCSISVFPKYEYNLEEFYLKIKKLVEVDLKSDFCRVTRSSVAVDIIPNGFDKLAGLNNIKKQHGNNTYTCAIADSLNDYELLIGADLSCIPKNAHAHIIELLKKQRKEITSITNDNFNKNNFYFATEEMTQGVVEILEKLNKI